MTTDITRAPGLLHSCASTALREAGTNGNKNTLQFCALAIQHMCTILYLDRSYKFIYIFSRLMLTRALPICKSCSRPTRLCSAPSALPTRTASFFSPASRGRISALVSRRRRAARPAPIIRCVFSANLSNLWGRIRVQENHSCARYRSFTLTASSPSLRVICKTPTPTSRFLRGTITNRRNSPDRGTMILTCT